MGDGFVLADIVTIVDLFKPYVEPVIALVVALGVIGYTTHLVFRLLGFGKSN